MDKKVFIINGTGGSGKDTFINFIEKERMICNFSSVDLIKEIAKVGRWEGTKTEKDRKLLSSLKSLFTDYNDLPFTCMKEIYEWYLNEPHFEICFFHIREPEEIERAVKEFNAETILVVNNRINDITSNPSDGRVYDYPYDYIIENNMTLEDLMDGAKTFIDLIEGKMA